MDSSFATPYAASRWRTATIVAASLAALEFAALLAIGVTVLGKSVAHRVQEKAYAQVSGAARAHDASADRRSSASALEDGGARAQRRWDLRSCRSDGRDCFVHAATSSRASATQVTPDSSTRTLVMYRDGYRAEGVRLARDARAHLVSPLDGMPQRALLGAQVVIVVGR